MKRYLIEEAKCGISNGGMACGPVPGSVVASVKVNDGSKVQWLTMSETDGILNVSLSENDIYDKLIEEEFDDEFQTFMRMSPCLFWTAFVRRWMWITAILWSM